MKETEEMYQQALEGKKKALGPDHTSTLNTINNLGLLYSDQGKLKKAKKVYQQRLEDYKKGLGPDHSKIQQLAKRLKALSFTVVYV